MINMIAGLAPYRFLDLMRDKNMIPSEAPHVIVRRTSLDMLVLVRNFVEIQNYRFLDLLDDVAARSARRSAEITNFADAVLARAEQHNVIVADFRAAA